MSTKGEKRAARTVQELTGRSYCSALNVVRQWTSEGKRWDEELIKLANEPTVEEGALTCPKPQKRS